METRMELKTGMVFWKDGYRYELITFSSRNEPYLYSKEAKRRVGFKDWKEICEWLLHD